MPPLEAPDCDGDAKGEEALPEDEDEAGAPPLEDGEENGEFCAPGFVVAPAPAPVPDPGLVSEPGL